jgi:Domain of unknown function (DUF4157)
VSPGGDFDLSQVRIHADEDAARRTREAEAAAVTIGSDIYVGAGHQRPGTAPWHGLLAHELTPVAQQRRDGVRRVQRAPEDEAESGKQQDPAERYARAFRRRRGLGRQAATTHPRAGPDRGPLPAAEGHGGPGGLDGPGRTDDGRPVGVGGRRGERASVAGRGRVLRQRQGGLPDQPQGLTASIARATKVDRTVGPLGQELLALLQALLGRGALPPVSLPSARVTAAEADLKRVKQVAPVEQSAAGGAYPLLGRLLDPDSRPGGR